MALRDLNDAWGWIQKLVRRVSRLESGAMLENSSISNGRMRFIGGLLRVDSGGSVQIVGTLSIDGTTAVTGTFTVSGPWNLTGNGTITGNVTATGTLTQNGPWNLNGTGTIAGNVTQTGSLTVAGGGTITAGAVTITPSGGGRVQAGTVAMDGGGGYGGRVFSTGATLMLDASGSVIVEAPFLIATNINASGDLRVIGDQDVSGAKNFRMPHPTKPDHWIRHGSTESPVSGTEYTGRVTLGGDGVGVVDLPEYFEALNKPRNRTVQVTPIGSPFPVGVDAVADGKVTIYGEPGRDVFWLVKAERFGGDFILEEPIPEEPINAAQ